MMEAFGASALAALDAARARIAAIDKAGPGLNAVLEINPQAEGLAIAADGARASGAVCGPLHGVPVLLKDNIDTGDMMHTSAGSRALAGRYAPRDAHVAARLRAAGAVLLGKANMTEFANYMGDRMPAGYSSRGGQVRSPWGPGHDPSGSSTGSAVAVTAGYVPLAIGTETMGSIIAPAVACGIVGVKPTVGVVSRAGILPISISMDTAGPMARSVMDCAVALDAMAGPDMDDPYTLHGRPVGGYAAAVQAAPEGLRGVRLGLANVGWGGKPVEKAAFLSAVEALRRLGAEVVEVTIPLFDWSLTRAVMGGEFRACMDGALRGSLGGGPDTVAAIVAYNRAHADECLRYGQGYLERALWPGATMGGEKYLCARQAVWQEVMPAYDRLFEGFEAVVTPLCGPGQFPLAGLPSVAVPVGLEDGKPVAMVLNGPAFSERALLRVARAVERAVGPGALPPL